MCIRLRRDGMLPAAKAKTKSVWRKQEDEMLQQPSAQSKLTGFVKDASDALFCALVLDNRMAPNAM